MKRDLLPTFAGLVSIAAVVGLVETRAMAVQNPDSTAQFDSSRKLKLPTGYRRWIPWALR